MQAQAIAVHSKLYDVGTLLAYGGKSTIRDATDEDRDEWGRSRNPGERGRRS